MQEKCNGLIGRIFGHRFSPVITKGAPQYGAENISIPNSQILQLTEASRPQSYHGIYCKRCGKVING